MPDEPGRPDEALLAQFMDDYYAECDEHLTLIRTGLLSLERSVGQSPADRSLLDDLLRAFHSIKGLSGMVGVAPAEELAHAVESQLRRLSQDSAAMSAVLYERLAAATELIEQVIAARRSGQAPPPTSAILAQLAADDRSTPQPALLTGSARAGLDLDPAQAARLAEALQSGGRLWRFVFAPAPELAARGLNVNSVRARLLSLGPLIRATPQVIDQGRVVFDFLVVTQADESSFAGWQADGIMHFPYDVEAGQGRTAHPPAGAAPDPLAGRAGLAGANETAGARASVAPANYVRVDLARLDDLMHDVGELVIRRARLAESVARLESRLPAAEWRALQDHSLALERGLRNLRGAAMRVRLVPIGEVFTRLQFAMHDLARADHKQVTFEISGHETEIDKMVVERMLDPLLHLARNAVSHGIEPAAERLALGKPPEGKIGLRAATAGDMVIIQVEDDGRGVDVARVAARAHTLGLLGHAESQNGALQGERLVEILCAPGFSTRDEADLASGRGVGMTVVYHALRSLGGTLGVETAPGRGTRFTIQLPLTLAIVGALIVSAGGQTFAVPQLALSEVIEIEPATLHALENNEVVVHRGAALPVLRLARVLGLPEQTVEAGPARRPGSYALVVGAGTKAVGLAVDGLRGQREIVVAALEDPLVQVPGIAGATELGDGRVILILDPAALAGDKAGAVPPSGHPIREDTRHA